MEQLPIFIILQARSWCQGRPVLPGHGHSNVLYKRQVNERQVDEVELSKAKVLYTKTGTKLGSFGRRGLFPTIFLPPLEAVAHPRLA